MLTDNATDTGGNQSDEFGVRGPFGFDEDGFAGDHRVYGFKPGCFHRLARF